MATIDTMNAEQIRFMIGWNSPDVGSNWFDDPRRRASESQAAPIAVDSQA
jgi:hypothetical protein